MTKKQTTCRCNAYSFPHRQGGGKCQEPIRRSWLYPDDDWAEWADWKNDEAKIEMAMRPKGE